MHLLLKTAIVPALLRIDSIRVAAAIVCSDVMGCGKKDEMMFLSEENIDRPDSYR